MSALVLIPPDDLRRDLRRIVREEVERLRPTAPASEPPPPRGEYATTRQAAEYLGVCARTLARWRKAGRLASYKVGEALVYYKWTDLDALIQSGAEPGPTA